MIDIIYRHIFTQQASKQFRVFAAGHSLDVVWIACFGVYVFVFLLCRCLLEDARKKDYCGLNSCVADICAVHAYAVGNMDVKSVDTFNYLLFHLRLRSPTFRPPLRLKFCDFSQMSRVVCREGAAEGSPKSCPRCCLRRFDGNHFSKAPFGVFCSFVWPINRSVLIYIDCSDGCDLQVVILFLNDAFPPIRLRLFYVPIIYCTVPKSLDGIQRA